jgi:type IV pilus assembly protein PilB
MAARLGELVFGSNDNDLGGLDPSRQFRKGGSEISVVDYVNSILADAALQEASDIHFESYEKDFRIRFRIDGFLRTWVHPPSELRDGVISRLKVMANLDIGERRLPQEGRIKLTFADGGQIDCRISTTPTLFGEKVALRLLDHRRLLPELAALGLDSKSLEKLRNAVNQAYGMLLVTGPTGSGKTSTLYTCLNELNSEAVNIMTAEDPVEICLPGINQVQIDEQIGRTFATSLRSFLRQDPNIIMVGEIRDLETAEIAVKAALTGHLVLSTLHTNDAPSSINRLLHMGVAPYLVASSVNLICAQRLVRRICVACAEQVTPNPAEIAAFGNPNDFRVFRGRGCRTCGDTGYKGRTGLFEVMEMSPVLRAMIVSGVGISEIREQAMRAGMLTLRESGLNKICSGITTVEEVLRETG